MQLLYKLFSPPEKPQPGMEPTPREMEVLLLVVEGYTNAEIGRKLKISHRTAGTHRANLMKKIGAKNIAGVIKYALQNGYL